MPLSSHPVHQIYSPIFAKLLERRTTGLMIAGAAGIHAGLMFFELPSWQCPIRHTFGIPCPGCGLSRAMAALLRGDWQTSLTYHAFAPIFLAGLVVVIGLAVMPGAWRNRSISWIDQFERHTGLVALVLVALVVYWLARMFILRDAFINLIVG